MKASTSLALIISAVAVTSVNGGSLLAAILRPRAVDEIWGNVNITASVLEVYNAISQPTCNSTDYCEQLATNVVPRCLQLQGTAGCWCTLHDPIHYCAICMSNPTDNTTTPDQTQAATEGHSNYHKGCAAYQTYLNASAAGSLSTSQPPSTSAPLPTATSDAANSGSSKSVGTGAIVGIAIGGVCFLAVVAAATVLIFKCLNNNANRQAHPAVITGGNPEKQMAMGDPVRVQSYYTGTDMGDKIPNTPPPPMVPYQNQHMHAPQYNNAGQPISPHSMYSNGAVAPGARPDTMFSDAPTMSTRAASYQPNNNMRQGSEFGGSQGSGQPLMQGQYQVQNPNNGADLGPRGPGIHSPPPPFSAQPQP